MYKNVCKTNLKTSSIRNVKQASKTKRVNSLIVMTVLDTINISNFKPKFVFKVVTITTSYIG